MKNESRINIKFDVNSKEAEEKLKNLDENLKNVSNTAEKTTKKTSQALSPKTDSPKNKKTSNLQKEYFKLTSSEKERYSYLKSKLSTEDFKKITSAKL